MTEPAPSVPSSGVTAPMSGPPCSLPPEELAAALVEPDSDHLRSLLTSADIISIGPIGSSGPLSSRRGTSRSRPSPASHPGPPPLDPVVGMVLADRYRILASIGRGGMGSVYRVQHTRIGKLLAMKILSGEMSRKPEVVRRFKREALAVSKLQSPNTVQVFDFGVSDGLTYLVMELVPGESLGTILRDEGPLPVARFGRIVVQICNALAEAHHKGIVHRDIKPENVMLMLAQGGTEVVKVLDFGLAKLRDVDGSDEETSQGLIVGTPNYMAPEQIQGLPVDARTDVYSLGALMYRLLTGHAPFRAPSQMAVLEKHLHERPIPPADRAPDLGIPLGVSRLVMRALRKDPADRFQRVEDLQGLLVDELRLSGSSSVESLLDADRLRRIARPEPPEDGDGTLPAATRDEVDAYERDLRRRRYGRAFAAASGAAVTVTAAVAALLAAHGAPPGAEIEPNDTPAEATPLALGQPMTGQIGRRLDATHGDRDFYALDLPAAAPGPARVLRLQVTALPNIALCALLYRPGFADPVGQYCVGRPGRDLVIPALALAPGRYLLAVLQDGDGYGGAKPYVYESISDTYTILAESVTTEAGAELEPNDHLASATRVALGAPCTASLGWAHDEDFFCAPEGTPGALRWSVRAGHRERAALEATVVSGGEIGAPSLVSSPEGTPWQSAPMADDGRQRCLRVRLVGLPGGPGVDPAGGDGPYTVEPELVLAGGSGARAGSVSSRSAVAGP